MKLNFRVRVEVVRKLQCYEPSTVELVGSHVYSVAAKGRDYYRHDAHTLHTPLEQTTPPVQHRAISVSTPFGIA